MFWDTVETETLRQPQSPAGAGSRSPSPSPSSQRERAAAKYPAIDLADVVAAKSQTAQAAQAAQLAQDPQQVDQPLPAAHPPQDEPSSRPCGSFSKAENADVEAPPTPVLAPSVPTTHTPSPPPFSLVMAAPTSVAEAHTMATAALPHPSNPRTVTFDRTVNYRAIERLPEFARTDPESPGDEGTLALRPVGYKGCRPLHISRCRDPEFADRRAEAVARGANVARLQDEQADGDLPHGDYRGCRETRRNTRANWRMANENGLIVRDVYRAGELGYQLFLGFAEPEYKSDSDSEETDEGSEWDGSGDDQDEGGSGDGDGEGGDGAGNGGQGDGGNGGSVGSDKPGDGPSDDVVEDVDGSDDDVIGSDDDKKDANGADSGSLSGYDVSFGDAANGAGAVVTGSESLSASRDARINDGDGGGSVGGTAAAFNQLTIAVNRHSSMHLPLAPLVVPLPVRARTPPPSTSARPEEPCPSPPLRAPSPSAVPAPPTSPVAGTSTNPLPCLRVDASWYSWMMAEDTLLCKL